ncbi:exocyst complex component 3-like protein 4 [Esox lucius]|uniref:Exocyst complex component Sec6 n=1 Tax=Esox lucius TaxID=8010 RepID=A0A3P9A031_ESOLU|nr:exocyst complex component 3-like protein 4 [Esox lucius]XP_010877060.3 exocyst complex component 3-like protein 4 [Esox lucius]XP_019909360.2 exocyst complex component 3-like protein 4 [Esox lucius]
MPSDNQMAEMEEPGDKAEVNTTQGLMVDPSSLKFTSENNGNTHIAKKRGMIKQFRESMRLVGEKSPLAYNSKGSSNRPNSSEMTSLNHQLVSPPSPSLSACSPVTSPVKSQNVSFQSEEGGESAENSPPSQRKPSRTPLDTSAIGDTLLKKGASFRRGLRLVGSKIIKSEQLPSVTEITLEKKERVEEQVREKEKVEITESYTPPEIPLTPLSVMQISQLIEKEVLEEAHLNLLSLRQEFQLERKECTDESSSMELAKKEKDLSILYGNLLDKVKEIVRNSSSLLNDNKDLLLYVARVIQEEEKRESEPVGIVGSGGWRGAWREAVSEGVQANIKRVNLESPEQNASWLAVHLGLLGKAITEDLEKVKGELQGSYPPSFNVFSTYVNCYHVAVSQHLRKLQQQVTHLKDYYALLDWIINRYESEKIMRSPSLRPEMEAENTGLCLEEGFLDKLKEKFCMRVKEDMRTSLGKILELESADMWGGETPPKTDDENFFNCDIHMDIWTKVKSNAVNAKTIDANLEMRVVSSCLEELQHFPKQFEVEFRNCCNSVENLSLWAEYKITYINCFTALKEHMESYRESCPNQLDHLSREVDVLVHNLLQGLEDQYKNNVGPYLRRMMTRKWLSVDEDFQQLYSRTEKLSQYSSKMRPPYAQMFVSSMHYYVVKEYVSQLMKNNYTCKNRKHDKAAIKMRVQWDKLKDLFEEMKTTNDWLHPVGDHLSDIIGGKNERDIKNHVAHLVMDYPDISKKHLIAVLYFRGLRGREKQEILHYLTVLKKDLGTTRNNGDKRRGLFSDIQVTNTNTSCLADMPFSCFSFLQPDS